MSLDYSELGEKYGLTILKGAEAETAYEHVLVFDVTPELQQAFDFTNIHLALVDVIAACDAHGAVPVPCHPGRKRVGMGAHLEEFGVPDGVRIVEVFNGGSRDNEDAVYQRMVDGLGSTASVAATHTLSAISVAPLRNSNNPYNRNKNWLAR